LKTTPTALKTLRRSPSQDGQIVNDGSLNLCTTSRSRPQSLHWYW